MTNAELVALAQTIEDVCLADGDVMTNSDLSPELKLAISRIQAVCAGMCWPARVDAVDAQEQVVTFRLKYAFVFTGSLKLLSEALTQTLEHPASARKCYGGIIVEVTQ